MAKAKVTEFPSQEEAEAEDSGPNAVTVKAPEGVTGWADVGGSKNEEFNQIMLDQAANAIWLAPSNARPREVKIQAVLAAMVGIGPGDEIEGMLAAQMVAVHNAAMECLRRAMIPDQTFEGRDSALRHAAKLTRTYTAQMAALNHHRGKGLQKMIVEHIHVHDGGQAIVGTVNPKGGSEQKDARQPHAKPDAVTHAPEPAMPCQDAPRNPVPVRGDAERPVSHARR